MKTFACTLLLALILPSLAVAQQNGAQVWFAPLDPLVRPSAGFGGSTDYMDLFSTGSPWSTAASHVQVFKIYPQWIYDAPDADLQRMFADLDRRGIMLALEYGVLAPTSYAICGLGVEGFGGETLAAVANRIKKNGGTLKFLAMDEPAFFGSMYTGTNACRWSIQDVAVNAVTNLQAVKAVFPNVLIGDAEPVPAPYPDWLSRYQEFMDAYRNASGANLDFFHSDVLWLDNWRDSLDDLRRGARARQIPFGVIYNGSDVPTSPDWLSHAEQHFTSYELGSGQPDHAVFQSWDPQPQRLLPETDPLSFTALINRYFKTRTRLTLGRTGDIWNGQLSDEFGRPLPGSQVVLTATLLSSAAIYAPYSISGAPPPGTKAIAMGMRSNSECDGCSAATDIVLYGVEYREAGGPNLISNSDFSRGMTGWAFVGSGSAFLEPNDRGGSALHMRVSPSQTGYLNSSRFTVSGAPFTATFNARVSASSMGGGYFVIFFLGDNGEIARTTMPYVPATIQFSVTTGNDGTFSIPGPNLPPGSALRIDGRYDGALSYWPVWIGTEPGSVAFSLRDRGALSYVTSGTASTIQTGYSRIQPTGGPTTSGLAIFQLRQNNVMVSETGVPASLPLMSGRIYAETLGSVRTGVAIANPNSSSATVKFFYADVFGNSVRSGQTTIAAKGQLVGFLDAVPFNGPKPLQGTFTFTSNLPLGVTALRGLTNERGEFLMSTLPVVDASGAAADGVQVLPEFADGGGWSTQIILVNPTNTTLTGNLQFLNPDGTAASVTINGQTGNTFAYFVAARSAQKLSTAGNAATATTGWVRVVPSFGIAPAGQVIFSYRVRGVTVSEAGVSVTSSTALRMYVESSGPVQIGSVQSGIALVNSSPALTTVTLELTQLDGNPVPGVKPALLGLPGPGQASMFLSELFPSLTGSFKGVLRITANSRISSVGLLARYNERGDFVITTTPAVAESTPSPPAELEFPLVADGGGYTTQMVLFSKSRGQSASGNLQSYDLTGEPLNLILR